MKLILAEKPSVAKNIADALQVKTKKDGYFEGNNYVITWAFGHLVELYDAKDYDAKMRSWKMENFPFIPQTFKYKVKANPRDRSKKDHGASKQLQLIQRLMKRKEVEAIISACDYDREGQLIADSIIYHDGFKPTVPVYRLLLNEWTPNEVQAALQTLKSNNEMKPLRDAGISRQWADWAIGINLTSVTTLKFQKGKGKALNIGRVLLPTLKIIYDRGEEIRTFKPENYYKLEAEFHTDEGKTYKGIYQGRDGEKFKDRKELETLVGILSDKQAKIFDKQVERKKEFPPFLFNLSNLQGYITSKYHGFTSDKVLKIAQTLYEKKYITYPRTSSTALEESLVGKTKKVLDVHTKELPYKEEITFKKTKRVFNNKKVESHSAIIPTYLVPKRLNVQEKQVYDAIKNRFIMQFMPIAEHEETKLYTGMTQAGWDGMFLTKGRIQLIEGWKKVENIQAKEVMLPNVSKGELVELRDMEITDHVTKPPKLHTEKTLLKVMETCGRKISEDEAEELLSGYSIGTAATRADTIKKLKDIGYVEAHGKALQTTKLGRNLVETFPVKDLFDLTFTGRLEKELADIQKGINSKQVFLNEIFQFTTKAVEEIKNSNEAIIQEVTTTRNTNEVIGTCPACGGKITDGYKAFGCSNWKKGCKFAIWKNDRFLATMRKKPTKTMVKSLLANKQAFVKGLTSKNGKKFSAYLTYEKNEKNDYYSWNMSFDTKGGSKQ